MDAERLKRPYTETLAAIFSPSRDAFVRKAGNELKPKPEVIVGKKFDLRKSCV